MAARDDSAECDSIFEHSIADPAQRRAAIAAADAAEGREEDESPSRRAYVHSETWDMLIDAASNDDVATARCERVVERAVLRRDAARLGLVVA